VWSGADDGNYFWLVLVDAGCATRYSSSTSKCPKETARLPVVVLFRMITTSVLPLVDECIRTAKSSHIGDPSESLLIVFVIVFVILFVILILSYRKMCSYISRRIELVVYLTTKGAFITRHTTHFHGLWIRTLGRHLLAVFDILAAAGCDVDICTAVSFER
jgi:hypothetical protein